MIALFGTVVVASLAGSLHCLAMCGPLIGLAGGTRGLRLALAHAVGRLVTYVALGVGAGALGRAIDLAGRLGDIQRVATVLAAVTIFAWAIVALTGRRVGGAKGKVFTAGLAQIRSRRPARRAALIGVLTGLLPCGWLWAFVVSAAGTGSPLIGGLVMGAFWLGTVPAMTGALALGGSVIERLRARMPVVTALALVTLGIGTLAMRWPNAGTQGVAKPSCHEPGGAR